MCYSRQTSYNHAEGHSISPPNSRRTRLKTDSFFVSLASILCLPRAFHNSRILGTIGKAVRETRLETRVNIDLCIVKIENAACLFYVICVLWSLDICPSNEHF